ncbi:hypothetical protein TorRG33x02_221780, partial [Trema orientale]
RARRRIGAWRRFLSFFHSSDSRDFYKRSLLLPRVRDDDVMEIEK